AEAGNGSGRGIAQLGLALLLGWRSRRRNLLRPAPGWSGDAQESVWARLVQALLSRLGSGARPLDCCSRRWITYSGCVCAAVDHGDVRRAASAVRAYR